MAEEEVHLGGPLEQAGVLRVQEPAQAGARVEQQKARAFAHGEAGGLPRAAGHPAQRAEQCDVHVSSPSSSPACKRVCTFPADGTMSSDGARVGRRGGQGDPGGSTSDITTADLSLDEEARDLWEPALPHLAQALAGSEARSSTRSSPPVAAPASSRGCPCRRSSTPTAWERAVRERLLRSGGARREGTPPAVCSRWSTSRSPASRPGTPAASGDHRPAASPGGGVVALDVDSGAIKAGQLGERLSLEVERCQRMDLPLGLLELAVERATGESGGGRTALTSRLHQIGALPAREPAAVRQRGAHERRRLRAGAPRHQPAGARGGAERIRREVGPVRRPHGEPHPSSPSRWRTTTSWT